MFQKLIKILKTDFRFISVYQVINLSFLESKHAAEIAFNLLDIYSIFEAPVILNSVNRREFVNGVFD